MAFHAMPQGARQLFCVFRNQTLPVAHRSYSSWQSKGSAGRRLRKVSINVPPPPYPVMTAQASKLRAVSSAMARRGSVSADSHSV